MNLDEQNTFVLIILLTCWCAQGTTDKIRVLRSTVSIEEDGQKFSGAVLDADDREVHVEDLTVCMRFNFQRLGNRWSGRSQIIHISDFKKDASDPEFYLLFLGAEIPRTFIGFGHPQEKGSYKTFLLKDPETGLFHLWATNKWIHICIIFRKEDGFLSLVKDGKPLNVNYPNENLKQVTIPPDFLNKIYLLRCPFNYTNTCTPPEGQFTDFNIWDRALSQKEAHDWTTCRHHSTGNVVNWKDAQFKTDNMEEIDVELSDICIPAKPGHVLFPMMRPFHDHVSLCHRMRGLPTIVGDQALSDELMDRVEAWRSCGDPLRAHDGGLWAGYWDEPSEGNWTNVNTGNLLGEFPDTYQNWHEAYGEPNGDTAENCAKIYSGRRMWNDAPCTVNKCGACYLERSPDFQLLGLCPSSKFDTKYTWSQHPLINGRFSFRGYTDTVLTYDNNTLQWFLTLHDDSSIETYGYTNSTEYPFGTLQWQFFGDACGSDQATIELSFNACNESEFNCRDGHCINHAFRCDEKVDCPDKSDEIGCDILRTDSSYLKDVPPPPSEHALKESLTVDINVLSILEIVEVDNIISLQLKVDLTWLDRRLALIDLHDSRNLNTLTQAFQEKIWLPQVVFFNTIEKDESLNDNKAVITINKQGGFTRSPESEIVISQQFKGAQNPLTTSRVYSKEFLCKFDMASYPFDTQVCSVELIMKGNTGDFINMVKGKLIYDGPVDLSQYFIKGMDIVSSNSSVRVDMVFRRRLFATILTTYLPTGMICTVCFATNYFKAFFFEAVVTVNLTCLLVLTTLFIGVSNALPATAYIKLIDIWLLMTLVVPLTEVLLHTFIDAYREDNGREVNLHGSVFVKSSNRTPSANTVNPDNDNAGMGRIAHQLYQKMRLVNPNRVMVAMFMVRWFLPGLFVLFTLVYFSIGLSL